MIVSSLFIITALLTVFIFAKATRHFKWVVGGLSVWLLIQAIISLTGFYINTAILPPRLLLLIVPPLVAVLLLFVLPKGRAFLNHLDLRTLTWLHVVRLPVEVVLLLLFFQGLVPRIMTFEGHNYDIFSGLSAPVMAWLSFNRKKITPTVLLAWNIICLLLLLNIVIIAILSTPYPFQKLGFGQPNIAVLHFPYVWLPCCIVPLVLLSHLSAIRLLRMHKQTPVIAG